MLLLQPQGARRHAVHVDDDVELIERAIIRAKRGDPGGLSDIYGICRPKVYGFLRHMIRDEHQAEDLTQEVFIDSWPSTGTNEETCRSSLGCCAWQETTQLMTFAGGVPFHAKRWARDQSKEANPIGFGHQASGKRWHCCIVTSVLCWFYGMSSGYLQGRSPSCWARARAPYTPFTIAVAARSGAAWPSETWRPL